MPGGTDFYKGPDGKYERGQILPKGGWAGRILLALALYQDRGAKATGF